MNKNNFTLKNNKDIDNPNNKSYKDDIINDNKIDNNLNDINNSKDKTNNAIDNLNQNIENNLNNNINNLNNDNNNILNKKISILNKIINQNESKINKLLLKDIFNKWNSFRNDNLIVQKLKKNTNKDNEININKYKSSALPKKRYIKVRKIKNENSNNFSHLKSINSGKVSTKSFESDNINIKKMKIKKVNMLESKEIANLVNKESLNNKNSEIVDNSYFIKIIANITKKISIKSNIFKCFIYWKKKTKDNK